MYEMNDLDLWRQHRENLLQEGENGRLVRRLKAARQKRAARLWSALLGRGPAPGEAAGNLRAGDVRCA